MITHALQILIKAVAKTGALDETGKKTADLGKEVSGLQQKLSSLSKLGATAVKTGLAAPFKAALLPVKALTFALGALGAVLAGLGLVGFARKLSELPSILTRLVIGSMEVSAGLEGMRNAMWGIAGEAAPAMLDALQEASAFMSSEVGLLRQYNMGYMLLGETLSRRMPEAYQYLAKVSLATGDDVNFLMERLTRSVGRLSTRWMAYIGTVVSMEEAVAWAVQTTGKLADELTREQIQAAMLDRVLMRLEARTAALPDPMETLLQRLKQVKAEFIALRTDLSDHFVPAAKSLLKTVISLVKGFQRLVREGGALYRPLRVLAATFTVLFDIAGEGIENLMGIADEGSDKLETFIDKIISAAWNAIEWGANIVTNLAIGLVQGASSALTSAMNFISGMLEWWLAPGSAPRIVSNILDWGASAFTEFLKGFTMADFDVLEGVQRPLKRALDVLVGLDMLTPVGAGEIFIGLSEKMAEALDHFRETGEVMASVFDDLAAQVSGGYGESLAELWKRQLNLAISVERLAAAELRLKNAREGEEAAQTKLSKAAREYNKLVRAGADPAILRAKLQGVAADYDSLEAARKETEEAEEAKKLAAEEVKRQKEQVKLQERLLNQLILMGQAMIDLEKARKKEAAEDPFELPPIEWPEIHPPKLDQAFEDLKARIRAKFDELWAMVKAKWEESGVMESVGRIQEAWERLKTALAPVFTWLGERWDDLKKWATDDAWPWILDQWEKWGTWWDENGPGIRTRIAEIYQEVKDWAVENLWQWTVDEWGKWKTWWDEDGPAIVEAVQLIWDKLEGFMSWLTGEEGWTLSWGSIAGTAWSQLELLRENTSEKLGIVRGLFSFTANVIVGDWNAALVNLQGINSSFFTIFDNITGGRLGKIVETFQLKFLEIFTLVWDTWKGIKVAISEKLEELKILIPFLLESLVVIAAAWWGKFKEDANTIWKGIISLIQEKLVALFEWMGLDLEAMKVRWATIWSDVQEIVSTVWTRIKEWVLEALAEVVISVASYLKALKTSVGLIWAGIETYAKAVWASIKAAILYEVEKVKTLVLGYIKALQITLWGIWTTIKANALAAWTTLSLAVIRPLQDLWDRITGKIQEIQDWIFESKAVLVEAGKDMIQGLIDGVGLKAGELVESVTSAVERAIKAIKSYLGIDSPSRLLWGIGDQMIDGLIGAIRNKASQVADALRNVIDNAIRAIRDKLQLWSPSKVFEGFGENMVEGLVRGIDKLAKQPALSVGRMAAMTVPALSPAGIGGPGAAGRSGAQIIIHNHFGPDSIRSDQDILKMAEQQQRALTLRGVRDIIQ